MLHNHDSPSGQSLNDDEFQRATQFVMRLANMAYSYGVSVTRLDEYLMQLIADLGLKGECIISPPHINFVFTTPDQSDQYIKFVRLPPVDYNLTKLSLLGELLDNITTGNQHLSDALNSLDAIHNTSTKHNHLLFGSGYAMCGAGIAVLLSASWEDVLVSALFSIVVYAITVVAQRLEWVGSRLNLLSSLTISIIANTYAILSPGSNPYIVTICAVVVLIPGLILTLAMDELINKNIISGIGRLIDGVLITAALFIGSAVGTSIVRSFRRIPVPALTDINSELVMWISVAVLMLGLGIVFQVRRRDMVLVIVAGIITYSGVIIGQQLGAWQGTFFGALTLGFYASLFTRRWKRPTSIVVLPGLMILVPGIAAYFGVASLQEVGIMSGLPAMWSVFVQIAALIAGFYMASSFTPHKASL